MALYVILFIGALCIGMAISVSVFGTGGKRKKMFNEIYFSIEETKEGIGIFYTKSGDYSATLQIENPVEQYCANVDAYYSYSNLFNAIVQVLGEGYALHKQDVFCMQKFEQATGKPREYLSDSYFNYFEGRPYTEIRTYVTITQEVKKGRFNQYDAKKWNEFQIRLRKVLDLLKDNGVQASFLNKKEAMEFVDRYFAVNFGRGRYSMTNYKADEDCIYMGDRKFKMFSLVDVDSVSLPQLVRPYTDISVNNTRMPVDFMSHVSSIPQSETVVYNQIIYIPGQKRELAVLDKKKNRHASMPDASNQIAVEDIKQVQDVIARENKMLVYTHFNLLVCCDASTDMQKPTNHLENAFARVGIHLSRRAYNQMELFVNSFPGNCFRMNPEYDRFLTIADAAMCLMFKERAKRSEDSALEIYYTDRQGVPVAIDFSGKEGKVKMTDNSNFFCLGPSGSGKSFHMNSVVRQLYEQDTDIVMVDTGNSYEGLCEYLGGKYISYTEERPITMNPFHIKREELNVEKMGFMKNMILLIGKGANGYASKEEEKIVNMVLTEYYNVYFNGFSGFNEEERQDMQRSLQIDMRNRTDEDGEERRKQQRMKEIGQMKKRLEHIDPVKMKSADMGEDGYIELPEVALRGLVSTESELTLGDMQLSEEEIYKKEKAWLDFSIIHDQIETIERRRLELKVTSLSFNTFYEYAMQRVPDICKENNILFDFSSFRFMLKDFYRGGIFEKTLNEEFDGTLFDETFIVFEIDSIKDHKLLFPLVTLIIMDVFQQKMRIKKKRKTLIIEEAWKAIASPLMAEYIQYLFKTARKFWANVGVVTQEIQDIVDSPIVKQAIINNSDVIVLLDQSKFKERYDEIKAILGLTDVEVKKIFTINRLENKEGRSFFREVYIRRGSVGDVFGVEESRECYMTYTTERAEKDALKLYKHELGGSIQDALEAYCRDWDRSGIEKALEFAQLVHKNGKVLNLPVGQGRK